MLKTSTPALLLLPSRPLTSLFSFKHLHTNSATCLSTQSHSPATATPCSKAQQRSSPCTYLRSSAHLLSLGERFAFSHLCHSRRPGLLPPSSTRSARSHTGHSRFCSGAPPHRPAPGLPSCNCLSCRQRENLSKPFRKQKYLISLKMRLGSYLTCIQSRARAAHTLREGYFDHR